MLWLASTGPTWADEAIFAVLSAQLVLLVFGGFLGWRQLRAQIRPFVVVDIEMEVVPFIELVIANLGATMARDVSFEFDPPLQSTLDTAPRKVPIGDVSLFRDGVPSFPPGKRLVVLIDHGLHRTEAALPDRFIITVKYRGEPFGRRFEDQFVLDIATYREWGAVRRKTVHDVAIEMEKLRKTVEELGQRETE
jgi:hypothetical protein